MSSNALNKYKKKTLLVEILYRANEDNVFFFNHGVFKQFFSRQYLIMLERQQLKMLNMNAYQIVNRKRCRFEKGVRTMFSQFANEYIQVKMYVFHLCPSVCPTYRKYFHYFLRYDIKIYMERAQKDHKYIYYQSDI